MSPPLTARLMPAARRSPRALRFALAFTLAVAPATLSAQGQTLRFDGTSTGVHAFGYYVGPFDATFQRPGSAVAITVYCVDFLNSVSMGSVTPVNVTSLSGGSLWHTRHRGALDDYRRAAWLTDQYSLNPTNRWGGIQSAIWNIFAPGTPNDGKPVSNVKGEAYWTNQAVQFMASNAADAYDWGRFHVLTDTRAAGVHSGVGIQEFITASPDVTTPNVVPEPETWALMAIGLGGVAVIAARARRRS